ncbi:hypothetical protein [Gimesia maris]|uniref:AAA+ ATPase domain-containing protein n=1 Tax=Gimesia maris TaxID=122 RepID=A0ABX5YK30_9PLAN|nr:hypothetical protein [Gimesia maris]EDL61152.1 hypothetical protein PM8797T_02954 [Gimesia maris DSM 8797]QEG15985.1 hypothetical protein GmarT_18460 [Gimesia maris]QGQ30756.1 hypothetical protein F1729_20090 [Gimesia maris]
MNEFKLSKNRDAWFVIRGYKYQIDLTIKRWLSLKDDQKLVLEFGEDIDIVNDSISKGAKQFDRVLEQVKHLEKSITLRSSPCKIALANAIQHFKNNPQLNLAFRFCTNSLVTTERPSPFVDRKPAIEVWEELRLKTISEPERTERLTKLQSFLSKLDDKPQGVDHLTWDSFKDYVKNVSLSELEELIRCFEWSTQESNAEDISKEIFQLIKTKKIDVSKLDDVYPRLFLQVIEILSKREEKILDLQLLDAILSLPTLNDNEIELLSFLKSEVLSHSIRIEQLEKDSKQHEIIIAGIQQKLLEEKYGPQISLALSTAIGDISTELPVQVSTISNRETTVSGLRKILDTKNWIAIYGSIGCGKTQIASLLGEQLGAVIYVSLRDLNSDEANFLIHHLFSQLCDDMRTGTITESGLNALEKETVFFLDDVPRLISGDSLSRCLIEIAEKMAEKGHKLVTLSHYAIPKSIPDVLKKSTFFETPSPSLNSIETKELFEKHGAPDGIITPEIAESFVQSTSGNPTILAATARSISSTGWDQLEAFRAQSFNFALRGGISRRDNGSAS